METIVILITKFFIITGIFELVNVLFGGFLPSITRDKDKVFSKGWWVGILISATILGLLVGGLETYCGVTW